MEDNLNRKPLDQAPVDPSLAAENLDTPEANPLGQPQENNLETQTTEEEDESTTAAPRRSKKWILIGSLLVVFLAAAVFLGARLLKPQGGAEGFDKGGMMLSSKGGAGGAKSVRVNMTPAKELPQDKPTTAGIFVRREDQSIFIGTGNIQMMVKKSSSSSSGDVSSHYDGPVVEVVINHDTKVYQDTTQMPEPDTAKDGVVTAQQTVKPGSLDDLGTNGHVTVWGDKQGDRFIAKVIVFR